MEQISENKTLKKICLRCGRSWFQRCEFPRRCPGCRSSLWNVPGAKKPPRGRPSSFPVYSLRVGEFCLLAWEVLPADNSKRLDKIRRYSKRTGRRFDIESRPDGLKVKRIYDDSEPGII